MMFRLIVALAIAGGCNPALAQKKMYRCGNQFQERPCEGPKADAAASSATKADPQQKQETAAKRQERELAIHQAKCENYGEELGDINRRITAGADAKVMDQFMRRQKEMNIRIERECK
jgi:multidrug efflux pump subunit AcrB